ncbi:hypothetical protein TMPK1_29210 [Rhodospirillales bacterium TMPK1]|uniref:Uncharacterized protein n=2 Tax=Roseiterribacter gracilis TaxID=2812848 RepID=A0A8S8XDC8_9PROT|nr:hypothetical protein TMPK1_29210 [Rhodospirillales bacterium TMPK1]
MVPGLSREEFVELLEAAVRHRIFEYRGVHEHSLPRMMVVLMEYPHTAGLRGQRKHWYRFVVRSESDGTAEELWIDRNSSRLDRATFRPPTNARTKPKLPDLIGLEDVPDDDRWLSGSEPQVHKFVEVLVEEWFAARRAFAG